MEYDKLKGMENDILIAILQYQKECKKENFGRDFMETKVIEVLESAGIEVSR